MCTCEVWIQQRQKERQKQIIIGIVVSLDKGVPIYHFVDEGNVTDVTTKLNVDEKLKDLGVNNALMIHDRGMTSKENIRLSDKLAAYRLHTNPNYSHASSLFLSGGGFFLVKPTFSIIEPHFGHLILLFLIKFSGLQLFILLRKCFAYIFLVLLEYVP